MKLFLKSLGQGAGVALVFLAGALVGPRLWQMTPAGAQAAPSAVDDVLTAKEFRLTDDEGTALARLYTVKGEPVLSIGKAGGEHFAVVGIVGGEAMVALCGKDFKTRAMLSLGDNDPQMALFDKVGGKRAMVGLGENEDPGLVLWDSAGRYRAGLVTDKGDPTLALLDSASAVQAALHLKDGGGLLEVKSGKEVFAFPPKKPTTP